MTRFKLVLAVLIVWMLSNFSLSMTRADDLEEGRAAMAAKDYARAGRLLKPLAEQGDSIAQNAVGVMYLEGWGVSRDYATAMAWFRRSAEQGNERGQFNLGRMYDEGWGVKQDYLEAIKWYRRSAEHEFAPAQSILGAMYATGDGVKQDYNEAMIWYRKAADQGDPEAQRRVGLMFVEGQGVRKDDAQAVRWFRSAASQGHAGGQYWLGRMYWEGWGVKKDSEEGLKWMRLAARQGMEEASSFLDDHDISPKGDQKAIVHFYHDKKLAFGSRPTVSCNDAKLAKVPKGRYFSIEMEPGTYVCETGSSGTETKLILEGGSENFVKIVMVPGGVWPKGVLKPVSYDQGVAEMGDLSPIDPGHIKDSRVQARRFSSPKMAPAIVATGTAPAPNPREGGEALTKGELISYTALKEQFTIEIPSDWHVTDQSTASGDSGPYGVVSFSSVDRRNIRLDPNQDIQEQVKKISEAFDTGEWPSFFIDRYEAVAGMTCEGVNDKAKKQLLHIYTKNALGDGSEVVGAPQTEPVSLGGCKGLRVLVRAKSSEGWDIVLLVYTVSDGRATYDIALRNRADYFEKNKPLFEKIVSTLTLTEGVARK